MEEEKYFRCISGDYRYYQKGKIYPGSYTSTIKEFNVFYYVKKYNDDWQEVSKYEYEAQERGFDTIEIDNVCETCINDNDTQTTTSTQYVSCIEKYFKCLVDDYANFTKGKIYPGSCRAARDFFDVFHYVEEYPNDWQEVSKEEYEAQEKGSGTTKIVDASKMFPKEIDYKNTNQISCVVYPTSGGLDKLNGLLSGGYKVVMCNKLHDYLIYILEKTV